MVVASAVQRAASRSLREQHQHSAPTVGRKIRIVRRYVFRNSSIMNQSLMISAELVMPEAERRWRSQSRGPPPTRSIMSVT